MENEKKALRLEMMRTRIALPPSQKQSLDKSLEQQAIALINKLSARCIHIYLSLKGEVNTQGIIEYCWDNNIKVVVTENLKGGLLRHLEYQRGDELTTGTFQCRWPINGMEHQGNLDLIICPGLAFSKDGARLGYGGGYYDRFLIQHPKAWKAALALPFQVFPEVPSNKHDYKMNEVLIAQLD
jgi:5-formyltetrahydrofolate cyclo-ligase